MMPPPRPHPFDLVFGGMRDRVFPAIHADLAARDTLDAFLLASPALDLMHELRPDAGLADGVDDFVRFVYAAYRYWRDGEPTRHVDQPAIDALMATSAAAGSG